MKDKDAGTEAKRVIEETIEFLRDLKKHIKGPDIQHKNLAIWTVFMLESYIKRKLMHDVTLSIKKYNEKKIT